MTLSPHSKINIDGCSVHVSYSYLLIDAFYDQGHTSREREQPFLDSYSWLIWHLKRVVRESKTSVVARFGGLQTFTREKGLFSSFANKLGYVSHVP